MILPPLANQLLTSFSQANSWEQRMRLLMQAGASLEELTTEELTVENHVQGCESQVWLVAQKEANNWHFKAYSEARLIKGLLAVIIARVNGLTSPDIAQINLSDWFNALGLTKQLSSSRRDGLQAIWQRIQHITQA